MGRVQRANIVGLPIVVPSYDFEKPRGESKDLSPALVPEQVGGKDEVLTVRYLETVMS